MAVLAGIGGLVGGIFGDVTANKAGKQIQNAAGAGTTAIGTAGNQAAAATQAGVTGVQAATQAGVTGVQAATQAGQGNVNASALQAQTTAGNLLGGELGNLDQYNTTGETGSAALRGLVQQGFQAPTAEQAAATPGEQFALSQGAQALTQGLGATGGAATGGAQKALTQYGENVGSTYYQQAFNNAQATYGTNLGAANTASGQGLQAAGLTNQAAQNYQATTEQNLLGAQQYNAGLGLQGATTAGSLGLQGAGTALGGMETAGQQNLSGTEAASQMFLQGSQNSAAAQVGGANSLTSGLSAFGTGLSAFGNNYFNPASSVAGNLGGSLATNGFSSPAYGSYQLTPAQLGNGAYGIPGYA